MPETLLTIPDWVDCEAEENPRQFCRERGYTSAMCLTYAFDPLFFERVILSDLWYGGTGDIVVVGDQAQIDEATSRCVGQVRHLGRRYHLSHAKATTFHSKVLLRVGPKGAAFWVGTGNLTHGGWGGNQELAVSWKVTADDPVGASSVRRVVHRVSEFCTGSISLEAVGRIEDQAWLAGAEPTTESSSPLVLTDEHRALADDLRARWEGRRFSRMRVCTGSTDEGGRFLGWCHRHFGIEECVVAVNPQSASFKPELLSELPFSVSIAPTPSSPHMHAKFYWFEGPDGCAAIVGSANCSAAAWLVPPADGGNVEAIYVYDEADESLFANVLKRFPSEHLSPEQVPGLGQFAADSGSGADASPYRILDLTLYVELGEIHAEVAPEPPVGTEAVLHVGDDDIPLRRSGDDQSFWVGSPPEEDREYSTHFGVVTVRIGDDVFVTPPRWVDHHDQLRHAARERRIAEALKDLAAGGSSSEKNQLLEDIELITRSLFGEPGAYPDPPREKRKEDKPTPSEASPIRPGDLVRSLAEIEELGTASIHAREAEPKLTLHGVMRALFGIKDKPDEVAAADEPEDEAGNAGHGRVRGLAVVVKEDQGRVSEQKVPSDAQRRRLKKQIDELQENLGSDNFVERCTATQLVQAAAFPLACAALGHSNRWLTAEEARVWVLRTTDLLLRVSLREGQQPGLLQIVRSRYGSEGRSETFDQVVGDGTLWLALIGALDRVDWTTGGGPMERALALREVVHSEQLVARAETGRLGALVFRLRLVGESETVLRQAAAITGILIEVESFLERWFDFLLRKQEGGEHYVGDLVWRKSGWGIVRSEAPITKQAKLDVYWRSLGRETRMVASGYFVNFRWASKQYRDLVQFMERLRSI